MISNERISRKQRLKSLQNYKAGIALALAVILLLLIVATKYRTGLETLRDRSPIKSLFQESNPDDLDSLVFQTFNSFGLNNPPQAHTAAIDSAGSNYVIYTQPWPRGMPLVFYARKLEEISGDSDYDFDFVQYGARDSLVCKLSSGNTYRVTVVVIPDRKTELEGRLLGVILRNIYELKNREIIDIIESKIPFGYLAEPDVFPAGEIKDELRSRWANSILKISVSSDEIARYNIRQKDDLAAYRNLAADLLNRHPNPALLDLERSGDIDYLFAETLIDQAKDRKMGYIYRKGSIDRVDSLAFSAGLTFISYNKLRDYTGRSFDDIRVGLIADLLQSKNEPEMIIMLDISRIGAGNYIAMMKNLRNIGVNILNINKLSDHSEFTIEDL